MEKVIQQAYLPHNSRVATGFGTINYQDIYRIKNATNKSAEEISKELMRFPGWVKILFFIRNRIVGVFGLKTDSPGRDSDTFFPLIENREEEIVMGLKDQHLDFRVSIMKNRPESTIYLITVVHFNTIWGRFYFFPVKPFHKIIVKTLLRRYAKS